LEGACHPKEGIDGYFIEIKVKRGREKS